ncbi:MAG: hypothetical protein HY302_12370 [Opitutae bacterium]|nr:hypothetical protein [Opitutae bacterium]
MPADEFRSAGRICPSTGGANRRIAVIDAARADSAPSIGRSIGGKFFAVCSTTAASAATKMMKRTAAATVQMLLPEVCSREFLSDRRGRAAKIRGRPAPFSTSPA